MVVGSAEHTRRFIVGSSSRTVAQPSTSIGQQSHNRADFAWVSTNTLDEKHYSLLYFS